MLAGVMDGGVGKQTLQFLDWFETLQNSLDGHCLLAENDEYQFGTQTAEGVDSGSKGNNFALRFCELSVKTPTPQKRHILSKSRFLNKTRFSWFHLLLMFILNGLYNLVISAGPSSRNFSSSILAMVSRFLVSALARCLSILRRSLSALIISRLWRLESTSEPLAFLPFPLAWPLFGVPVPFEDLFEVLSVSVLLGWESLATWLISLSLRKGFLRNDMIAIVYLGYRWKEEGE